MNFEGSKIIQHSISLLSKSEKIKLLSITIAQILLGGLDLVGVGLIGVLGALSVTGLESGKRGNRVSAFLNFTGMSNFSFQKQATIIGLFAAGFMVTKTLLSMLFTIKSLAFLSFSSANFGAKLAQKLFSQDFSEIRKRTNQENIFHLTTGANSLILGILGAFVSICSDAALIVVMLLGLVLVEPSVAIASLVFFACIGIILNFTLSNRAQKLGQDNAELTINLNESITEILDTYRELFVRSKIAENIGEIKISRRRISLITSKISFLPYINKYVLETSVVLGSLLLASYQFLFEDAGRAIGNLAIFLAAGLRIAPAILRLQQGFIQVKVSSGAAIPTLELFNSLTHSKGFEHIESNQDFKHEGFIPNIKILGLNFTYSNSNKKAIDNLNLEIPEGSLIAIVGKSGAGKSTFADLLLGVLKPNSGEIYISGKTPIDAISCWPGAIAYVPQDVAMLSTSIKRNVTLEREGDLNIDQYHFEKSLLSAQLKDFVDTLPGKSESKIGERGAKLSGGQRQRLGIARALYTNPRLIVLDEATSSLDAETEHSLNESIQNLRGKVTLVVIAHRLATVRNADLVCYFDQGKLSAAGKFDEVRSLVPDFDKQAMLLGL
jgi:ATP-binding cassette, subfamily B, bacterial PglK